MGNPYTPSTSTASNTASNSQSPSEPPSRKTLSLIATAASALAIIVFVVVAAMLIPQAMRLGVEESGLPPRYQNGGGGMVQASWIGGLVAVAGVLANVIGIVLARRRKAIAALAICAASVIGLMVIAVMFKP